MKPAKLDFCDDNLKGGKNEVNDKKKIEGKGGDCSDDDPTLSRGADEKTKGGEKSEQSPHSDAEALAAPVDKEPSPASIAAQAEAERKAMQAAAEVERKAARAPEIQL